MISEGKYNLKSFVSQKQFPKELCVRNAFESTMLSNVSPTFLNDFENFLKVMQLQTRPFNNMRERTRKGFLQSFKAYSIVFWGEWSRFFHPPLLSQTDDGNFENLSWLIKQRITNWKLEAISLILKAKPPPQYRDKQKMQAFGFSCRISGPARVRGN